MVYHGIRYNVVIYWENPRSVSDDEIKEWYD